MPSRAADRAEPLAARRLDVRGVGRDAEQLGDGGAHALEVRRQPRLLGEDGHVDVARRGSRARAPAPSPPDEVGAGAVLVARVASRRSGGRCRRRRSRPGARRSAACRTASASECPARPRALRRSRRRRGRAAARQRRGGCRSPGRCESRHATARLEATPRRLSNRAARPRGRPVRIRDAHDSVPPFDHERPWRAPRSPSATAATASADGAAGAVPRHARRGRAREPRRRSRPPRPRGAGRVREPAAPRI